MGNGNRRRRASQGAEISGGDWRVAGGGCRRRLGGRRFSPGEEVGSGCKIEGLRRRTLIMGIR